MECSNDLDYFNEALELLYDETGIVIIVDADEQGSRISDNRIQSLIMCVLNMGKIPVFGSYNKYLDAFLFYAYGCGEYLYINREQLFNSGLRILI